MGCFILPFPLGHHFQQKWLANRGKWHGEFISLLEPPYQSLQPTWLKQHILISSQFWRQKFWRSRCHCWLLLSPVSLACRYFLPMSSDDLPLCMSVSKFSLFGFLFLASPLACGSSRVGDRTHTTAATGATAVTTPDPEPTEPEETSGSYLWRGLILVEWPDLCWVGSGGWSGASRYSQEGDTSKLGLEGWMGFLKGRAVTWAKF